MKTAKAALTLTGSAILAFGLCNIHAFASVTEGGVLGLVLLLQYWFGISPAISGLVLNAACFLLGWRTMGRGFLAYSALAVAGFSVFYVIFAVFFTVVGLILLGHSIYKFAKKEYIPNGPGFMAAPSVDEENTNECEEDDDE